MPKVFPASDLGREIIDLIENHVIEFNGVRRKIDNQMRIYTIIGVGHLETKARYFHESINVKFNLNQIHLPPIEIFDLERAILDMLNFKIRGLTITIPHKELAYKLIKERGRFGDYSTYVSGAVNTIINNDGTLVGWNTDITGFAGSVEAAKEGLVGITVTIVGCGGMGRAAINALCEKRVGAIKLFDVDVNKSKCVFKDFFYIYPYIKFCICSSICNAVKDSDMVVNCTPVGMKGYASQEKTAIYSDLLSSGQIIFDSVYVPLNTQFIRDASARGLKIISGLEMVVWGGIKQIELYSGLKFSNKEILQMYKVGKQAILKSFT